MKKLLYGTLVLALVGIAFTFSSCEKSEIVNNNIAQKKRQRIVVDPNAPWMKISNGRTATRLLNKKGSLSTFYGSINGFRTDGVTFLPDLLKEFENLTIKNCSPKDFIYVTNEGRDNEKKIGEFIKLSQNHFSFSIKTKKSEKMIFTIEHNGEIRFDEFVNGIQTLSRYLINIGGVDNIDSIDETPRGIPVAIYAIGVLLVGLTDIAVDHCQEIVNSGIIGCSASGKCYKVGACSVTCYTCDDN